MATHNSNQSKLKQLRELLKKGELEKLRVLTNSLKAEGYPEILLRDFRPQKLKATTLHPYIYEWDEETRDLGQISPCPLVSIIIVSYNSENDLKLLLPSIKSQTYKHWELIVIENGEDCSQKEVKSLVPEAKFIQADNPGFAEANNIGLEHAEGELLLILNPDTRLKDNTIKELVHSMRIDSHAAAACPAIYFWAEFYKLTVEITQGGGFVVDLENLLKSLEYKKIFIREGQRNGEAQVGSGTSSKVSVDIALNPDSSQIELVINLDNVKTQAEQEGSIVKIGFEGSGESPKVFFLEGKSNTVSLDLSSMIHSSSRYLINNAGSGLRKDDGENPYDIGYGEVDIGAYSARAYREAFCGCCVLLRRDLFIKRKIFMTQFFAYYEDSELSHWIRENRMKILYAPSAAVYHRHSESTNEGSSVWLKLVTRSRDIYNWIKINSKNEHAKLADISNGTDYRGINTKLAKTLTDYDSSLAHRRAEELISRAPAISVGIYNSYWNSMGGGEKHALDIAEVSLLMGCETYLISETDFSIDGLATYFNKELQGAKKLISGKVSESLTQRFDIFINSTFLSTLRSRAATSYYVVSFPQKTISRQILESYQFLHNSEFTRDWANRYWGPHSCTTLFPVIGFAKEAAEQNDNKKDHKTLVLKDKIILSVGRFNYNGHCKNHHLIAKVVKQLFAKEKIKSGWQLVIAGSYNNNDPNSKRHYQDTKMHLEGTNSKILANASRIELDSLYRNASIYIHGAGLGVDEERNPEMCEHFGISVFEALLHNCIPIVHRSGGPSSLRKQSNAGYDYKDLEELERQLLRAIESIENCSSDEHGITAARTEEMAISMANKAYQSAQMLFHH